MCRFCLALSAAIGFLGVCTLGESAQVTAERSKQGVVIRIDGQLFTEYIVRSGPKPILWPIIGPTGKPMTRAFPMAKGQNERQDHVHQRSMWFTHGDVNGISFWHEQANHGTIVHREFVLVESGTEARVVTRNDWVGPDGTRHCEDERRLTFALDGDARRIDFDITLRAPQDRPVRFGDTKEGTMGLRIAQSMNVDSRLGGRIVNSEGQTDAAAWGQRAAWVDYHGPVDGELVGIAILNHPTSFRFPTYWHVRTYGLFTANPFGWRDFQGSKDVDGSYTLPPGKSITLRYRILFHRGNEKTARIADAFVRYAAEAR